MKSSSPLRNVSAIASSILTLTCLPMSVVAFSVPPSSSALFPASASTVPPITSRRIIPTSTALYATREATFGMGCFWEPSETLLKQPGILASAVGYTGAPLSVTSRQPPPTYDTVCFGNDYVEAVRVVYDDSVVTYETVLDYFYKCQKPGYTRQYASVIFVNDEKEGKIAKQWKLDRQSSSKESAQKQGGNDNSNFIYDNLSIEPAASFYRAEEYHQRYWEKQRLRALFGLALIAGESGAYNTYLENIIGKQMMEDLLFGQSFDTLCGGVFLAGAGWMLVERLIARDVRELKPGDLIQQL